MHEDLAKKEKMDVHQFFRRRCWVWLITGRIFLNRIFLSDRTVKVKNPDLYFGLSKAALRLSGAISSIIGSYYVD